MCNMRKIYLFPAPQYIRNLPHTVEEANLCTRQGIRRVEEVAAKEAYKHTVHTINIISQWQYFVGHTVSSTMLIVSLIYTVCTLIFLLPTTVRQNTHFDPR
jgi:predicted transcriptional regulator